MYHLLQCIIYFLIALQSEAAKNILTLIHYFRSQKTISLIYAPIFTITICRYRVKHQIFFVERVFPKSFDIKSRKRSPFISGSTILQNLYL